MTDTMMYANAPQFILITDMYSADPPGLIYKLGDHSDHPFPMYIVPLRGSLYLHFCRIFGGLIPTYSGLFRLAGHHYGTPVGQCSTRRTHSTKNKIEVRKKIIYKT
jgi:hypothetical protein